MPDNLNDIVYHIHYLFGSYIKGIFSHKMFGFNITPEAIACIVGPIIMLGARRTLNLQSFLPEKIDKHE